MCDSGDIAAAGQNTTARELICHDLTELIRKHSNTLEKVGFTPDMAQFDCLLTVKIIVDELYDSFNVGHARKEWYREYVQLNKG
jgi:hypothetical protein